MNAWSYDDAEALLRRALRDCSSHMRAFATRARGRPELLGAQQWAELAQIEAIAAEQLRNALRAQLRAAPGGFVADTLALYGGVCGGLIGEQRLLEQVRARCQAQPVDEWRRAAPQLEDDLWPFFCDRTHHLANAVALALNEPAPYPAIIWQPQRQAFRR